MTPAKIAGKVVTSSLCQLQRSTSWWRSGLIGSTRAETIFAISLSNGKKMMNSNRHLLSIPRGAPFWMDSLTQQSHVSIQPNLLHSWPARSINNTRVSMTNYVPLWRASLTTLQTSSSHRHSTTRPLAGLRSLMPLLHHSRRGQSLPILLMYHLSKSVAIPSVIRQSCSICRVRLL